MASDFKHEKTYLLGRYNSGDMSAIFGPAPLRFFTARLAPPLLHACHPPVAVYSREAGLQHQSPGWGKCEEEYNQWIQIRDLTNYVRGVGLANADTTNRI